MPIPKPHSGESEQDFMARCMPFVTDENEKKSPNEKHSHAQLVAMCMSQLGHRVHQRHVTLHTHLKTKMLGNALLIEGVLLRPGMFTGLDGVPTKYTEMFIHDIDVEIQGKPIKFAHSISPEPMVPGINQGEGVGYWTGFKKNGVLRVRGYVFDPIAIKYAQTHPNLGLSMEADVAAHSDAEGIDIATAGKLTGGVLIDDPACPTCKVEHAREVNLQSEENLEKVENTMSASNTAEDFLTYAKDAKPTRESFFAWLETQLKGAGIPENVMGKVMEVLKKSVKVPYPYPYPKAQAVLEAELGKDLAGSVSAFLSEYTDFVKECMAGGKSMVECSAEYKKKGAPTTPPEGETKEMGKPNDAMAQELAETKAQLKILMDERTAREKTEMDGMIAEIKSLDETFEPVKFLEGIKCPDVQRKMLGKYLDVMKKNRKPIRLQVGQDEAKSKVNDMVKEMFGDKESFESIFEVTG